MFCSAGLNLPTHGAPSRVCRLAEALRLVSSDAVGCQNARSGLSPEATLVCTSCSYGSGIVTILIFAPVAALKSDATFFAIVLLFWAAQMVNVVPSSLAVSLGQADGAEFLSLPEPGLLHAARTIDATATAAAPILFRIATPRMAHYLPRRGFAALSRMTSSGGNCGPGASGGAGCSNAK